MSLFLKYLPGTHLCSGAMYKWTYQWELSLATYKQYKSCCNWYECWQNPWSNKASSVFSPAYAISHVTSSSKCYHRRVKSPRTYLMAWILWLAGKGGFCCVSDFWLTEPAKSHFQREGKNAWPAAFSWGIMCLQHWYVEYFSGQTFKSLDYINTE